LQEEGAQTALVDTNFESFIEQLDYSLKQLNDCKNEPNVIFDCCPVDFLTYTMCPLDQGSIDINDTEVVDQFSEIREALNHLDLNVFLPINKKTTLIIRKMISHFEGLLILPLKEFIEIIFMIFSPGMITPELLNYLGTDGNASKN
jgi:hypothetical protein